MRSEHTMKVNCQSSSESKVKDSETARDCLRTHNKTSHGCCPRPGFRGGVGKNTCQLPAFKTKREGGTYSEIVRRKNGNWAWYSHTCLGETNQTAPIIIVDMMKMKKPVQLFNLWSVCCVSTYLIKITQSEDHICSFPVCWFSVCKVLQSWPFKLRNCSNYLSVTRSVNVTYLMDAGTQTIHTIFGSVEC